MIWLTYLAAVYYGVEGLQLTLYAWTNLNFSKVKCYNLACCLILVVKMKTAKNYELRKKN